MSAVHNLNADFARNRVEQCNLRRRRSSQLQQICDQCQGPISGRGGGSWMFYRHWLRIHTAFQIHEYESTVSCDACGQKSANRSRLAYHLMARHDFSQRWAADIPCRSGCEETFPLKSRVSTTKEFTRQLPLSALSVIPVLKSSNEEIVSAPTCIVVVRFNELSTNIVRTFTLRRLSLTRAFRKLVLESKGVARIWFRGGPLAQIQKSLGSPWHVSGRGGGALLETPLLEKPPAGSLLS